MKLFSYIRGRALTLKELNNRVKAAFERVKEETEDHHIAINENTNEISENYEYICELEAKIEKLTERVEQLQLYAYGAVQPAKNAFSAQKLTKEEQNVFTAVYTLEEEKGSVTFDDIAESTGLTVNDVDGHIKSLMEKRVPIKKKYLDNNAYLNIDEDFKLLQAKENVLRIEH